VLRTETGYGRPTVVVADPVATTQDGIDWVPRQGIPVRGGELLFDPDSAALSMRAHDGDWTPVPIPSLPRAAMGESSSGTLLSAVGDTMVIVNLRYDTLGREGWIIEFGASRQ
jgi:hypothetical protein